MLGSFAGLSNGYALPAAGRAVPLRKPLAGAAETYRVSPGDTLDLSQIANENITLVKLGGRLVILFADRGFVVVDGLYLGDGTPSPDVRVGLNASTTLNAVQFVEQFPITNDTQVLTAAGINIGPLGSGGINLAAAPPGSALQPLSALTPDAEIAGAAFGTLPPSTFGLPNTPVFGGTPPGLPNSAASVSAANDTASVTESGVRPGNTPFAGTPSVAGSVTANDVATGALTVTGVQIGLAPSAAGNVGAAIAGVYGTLTLAADGSYVYALNNSDADTQALAQGQVVQEIFTYTVTDSLGQSATAQLAVTITGTNDAPVITSGAEAARGNVTEDGRWYEVGPPPGPFTANGTLTASDVDTGAVLTWSGNAAGLYGDFAIDPATGQWTYTLDDARSNGLAAGQAVTETFLATVTDEFGATATQVVTITVNGYNDEPLLDLDTIAAGRNYQGQSAAEAARSTSVLSPVNGATIVQTDDAPSPSFQFAVSDPDGDTFRSIQVEIRNTSSGDKGYLHVPGSVLAGAPLGSTLDYTSTHPSNMEYARTIRLSNGAGELTQANLEQFLRELRYVNTETTFALDTNDREIRVIVVDENGADQVATAYIPVIADVRDTTGLDTFTGTRFDDRIEGMGGSDTIRAGDGDDTLIYRAGDGTDALLDGGDGTDSLDMLGTAADDTFRVQTLGGTVDRMTSEGGAFGVTGNIVSIERITLDGLEGADDTLSYEGNLERVEADLAAGTATGFQSIANIENLTGGTQNDILRGDALRNVILGGEGDDIIDGRGGDNVLEGGEGDDEIYALDGDNLIDGGEGDNIIRIGDGDNAILVGGGDNEIEMGDGDNTVLTGDGDNQVLAGDGDNMIGTGDGTDTITTGAGDDIIFSNDGDDIINAGDGDNIVDACAGDDTIITGDGDDQIVLGAGDDRVTTGGGNDTLIYGEDLATIGRETITDFASGLDAFEIDHLLTGGGLAVGGADTGTLDASRFVSGTAFTNTTQRFLFDTASNTLYFDADGSGAGSAVALAQLESGSVAATDIRLT